MTHALWVVALLSFFLAGAGNVWGAKIKYKKQLDNGTVNFQSKKYSDFENVADVLDKPAGAKSLPGRSCKFQVKPKDGYKVKSWKITKLKDNTIAHQYPIKPTDIIPVGDYESQVFELKGTSDIIFELEVLFEETSGPLPNLKITYQNPADAHGRVIVKKKEGGEVVPEKAEGAEYVQNTQFLFEVKPAPGYGLEKLEAKEGSNSPKVIDPTSVYTLKSDVTFSFSFKEVVTVNYDSELWGGEFSVKAGSKNVLPGAKVFKGTELTLSCKEFAGYEIEKVTKKEQGDTDPVEISDLVNYKLKVTKDVTFAASFRSKNYKVTNASSDVLEVLQGGVAVSNGASVTYGTVLTFKTKIPSGKKLGNLKAKVGNEEQYIDPTRPFVLFGETTFIVTFGDDVTVKFAKPEHGDITIMHGKTNVTNEMKLPEGSVLSITLKPEDHYKTKELKIANELKQVKNNTFEYVLPKATEVVIAAAFEGKAKFTVTYSEAADADGNKIEIHNASGKVATGTQLEEGTALTIKAFPATGKHLDVLKAGTSSISRKKWNLPYILEANTEFTATFRAEKNHKIEIQQPTGGQITMTAAGAAVTSGNSYKEDSELKFTVTPTDPAKNKVGRIHEVGNEYTAYRDGMLLMEDMKVTAQILPIRDLKVFYATQSGAQLLVQKKEDNQTIKTGSIVKEDTNLKFILSNEQYELLSLYANGEAIDPASPFVLTKSTTFDYAVALKSFTVSYEKKPAGAHGQLVVKVDGQEVVPGTKLPSGTRLTLETIPEENYKLSELKANTTSLEIHSYKLVGDVNFTATFVEKPKYKVSYNKTVTGGTFQVTRKTATGVQNVEPEAELYEGTELSFVLTPNNTHEPHKVTVDGKVVTAPYSLKSTVTFVATFVEKANAQRVLLDAPAGVTVEVKNAGNTVTLDDTQVPAATALTIKVLTTPNNVGVKKIEFAGKDITASLKDGLYTGNMGTGVSYIKVTLNSKYKLIFPSPLLTGVTGITVNDGTTDFNATSQIEEGKKLAVTVQGTRTISKINLGDQTATKDANGKYNFVMPAAISELELIPALLYKVTFAQFVQDVKIKVTEGGNVVTSNDLVEEGKILKIKVEGLPEGRRVQEITLGTTKAELKTDGSYEVVVPAHDVTLDVVLVPQVKVSYATNEGVIYKIFTKADAADTDKPLANRASVNIGDHIWVATSSTKWTILGFTIVVDEKETTITEKDSKGHWKVEVPAKDFSLKAVLKPQHKLTIAASDITDYKINVTYKKSGANIENGALLEEGTEIVVNLRDGRDVITGLEMGGKLVTERKKKGIGGYYDYVLTVGSDATLVVKLKAGAEVYLPLQVTLKDMKSSDVRYTTKPEDLTKVKPDSEVKFHILYVKEGHSLTMLGKDVDVEETETQKTFVVKVKQKSGTVLMALKPLPTEYKVTIPTIAGVTLSVVKKADQSPVADGAKVKVGTELEVTATVTDAGAEVSMVTLGNAVAKKNSDNKFVITMPAVAATFGVVRTGAEQKYTLTFVSNTDYVITAKLGDTDLSNQDKVTVGELITINVKVKNAGLRLMGVKLGGIAANKTGEGTFSALMPNADATIELLLANKQHTFSFSNTEDYTVTAKANGETITSPATLDENDKIEFSVTPVEGSKKVIKTVFISGITLVPVEGKQWAYTFNMGKSNIELAVTLEAPKHQLFIATHPDLKTLSVSLNNQSVVSGGLVEEGRHLVVKATSTTRTIEEVLVNGVAISKTSDGKEYEFDMPTTDSYMTVKFQGDDKTARLLLFDTNNPEYTVEATMMKETEKITLTNPAQVYVGEAVSLTVKVKNGVAKFVKEVNLGETKATHDINNVNGWSFVMPDANVNTEVVLADLANVAKHKIQVKANGAQVDIFHGTKLLVPSSSEVDAYSELVIRVVHPNNEIAKVLFDGKELTRIAENGKERSEYMAVMPDKDVVVEIVLGDVKTAVEDAVLAAIAVSPNPFTDELRVLNSGIEAGRYQLFSLTGLPVAAGVLTPEATVIETSELPTGLYFLQITTEAGATKTLRVLKY